MKKWPASSPQTRSRASSPPRWRPGPRDDAFSTGDTRVKLQKILIGIDFSQPSTAGAKWVSEFLAPNAELTLLHVVEPVQHPQFASGLLPSAESLDAAAREDTMRRLREAASYLTASE